tara:strand:+ start:262 stop:459 length:198 start_codon:yes stop_codon:yes gene_type:complete
MWSITIKSNLTNETLQFRGKTISKIVENDIKKNPNLSYWLDETIIRNIRLGRRKHIEQWITIKKE